MSNKAMRDALAELERRLSPTMYYEAGVRAQKACEKIRAAIAEQEREAQALRETAQSVITAHRVMIGRPIPDCLIDSLDAAIAKETGGAA